MNADAGVIENVSMAATTAKQRESLVKVLESMAWALSQLWDNCLDHKDSAHFLHVSAKMAA